MYNLNKIKSIKSSGVGPDDFIRHAKRYIKAIEQGRVICNIASVSKSGMTRTIKFLECDGNKKEGYHYYNFFLLFKALGFSVVKNSDYFRIQGCGMDMIFNTNYTIINDLAYVGLLSKKKASKLAQLTPSVI